MTAGASTGYGVGEKAAGRYPADRDLAATPSRTAGNRRVHGAMRIEDPRFPGRPVRPMRYGRDAGDAAKMATEGRCPPGVSAFRPIPGAEWAVRPTGGGPFCL